MRHLPVKLFSILLIVFVAGNYANASSLTTEFNEDNNFAGNMFDVTTFGNALNVTAIDVNILDGGVDYDIALYTRAGSYVGFETNAAEWTLIDTVAVAGAGVNTPTFVDLVDFILPASSVTGFYVAVANYADDPSLLPLYYTNGTVSYANADLQIGAGIGRGDGFASSIFTPRIWNGTIYYTGANVPEPATLALMGLGLAGLGAARRRAK